MNRSSIVMNHKVLQAAMVDGVLYKTYIAVIIIRWLDLLLY